MRSLGALEVESRTRWSFSWLGQKVKDQYHLVNSLNVILTNFAQLPDDSCTVYSSIRGASTAT